MLLGITLLAPLCGPLLVGALGRRRGMRAAFDAFLIVAIGGLLLLHVLPEGLAALGWPGIPALLLGLVLPKLLHGDDHDHVVPDAARQAHVPTTDDAPASAAGASHTVLRALGAVALVLHAAVDGVVLAPTDATSVESLAVAIGLHRLIEGAGIWWLLSGRLGRPLAFAALLSLVGVTGVGFFGGHWALAHGFVAAASFLQMVVAGSLVHLLVWHPPQDEAACSMPTSAPPGRWQRIASATGAMLAGCVLLLLESHHEHGDGHAGHHHHAAAHPMLPAALPLDMLLPLSEAMLLALVCAALAHAVGQRRRKAGTRNLGPWRAALFGLFVPACSCGVVALAERRRRAGSVRGGEVAYLLAAPAMGWVGFLASVLLLGPMMTLLRAFAVLALPSTVARFVSLVSREAAELPCEEEGMSAPVARCTHHDQAAAQWSLPQRAGMRLVDGLQFAFGEMLDFTAPWLVFSMGLVFVLATNIPSAWVQAPTHAQWDVVLFSLVAMPVYLCAGASTLVATCLWRAGLSAGAVLSSLLLTSSVSIAAVDALWRWRGGAAAGIAVALHALLSIALGYGLNALTSQFPLLDVALWPPALAADAWLAWPVALATLLALLSLMRQGLRGFVGQLLWANGPQPASEHHV